MSNYIERKIMFKNIDYKVFKHSNYNLVFTLIVETLDKKKIILSETIKTLGTVTVDVKLYEGVMGKLKVDIIAE